MVVELSVSTPDHGVLETGSRSHRRIQDGMQLSRVEAHPALPMQKEPASLGLSWTRGRKAIPAKTMVSVNGNLKLEYCPFSAKVVAGYVSAALDIFFPIKIYVIN